MLLRFLGASNGSAGPEVLSDRDDRRKNGADEVGCVEGTTIERRGRAVALVRTLSDVGGDETRLGDVIRVSDLRPDDFEGVCVDTGVVSSPLTLTVVKSLSGLSESGRRLRPAGR